MIIFRIFRLAISICAKISSFGGKFQVSVKTGDHFRNGLKSHQITKMIFFGFQESKFECALKFSLFGGKFHVLVQTCHYGR